MRKFAGTVGPVPLTDRRITGRQFAAGALGLHLLAVVAIALPESLPEILTVPPIFVAIAVVPGALALLAVRGGVRLSLRWAVYAVGVSMITLMGLGAALNIALLAYGIDRPMTTVPLAVAVTGLNVGLAATVAVVRGTDVVEVPIPRPHPLLFAMALLPLLSIVSVKVLNQLAINVPLLLVLSVVAFVPLALVTFAHESWYGVGLWTTAVAILYHKALATLHNFSGSPDVVYTYEAGYWRPGLAQAAPESSELLANGVLYPSIAHLTQLEIFTEMEVVNPLFISLIPVALYLAARTYVDARRALLAGTLFAFAHPFYMQYPPAGRAGTPVIFLGMFALALTDGSYDVRSRQVLAVLFSVGVAVSHYGTSYLLLFGLAGAAGLLFAFPIATEVIEYLRTRYRNFRADRTIPAPPVRRRIRNARYGSGVITFPFIGFYATVDLAWYLYVDAGEKFHLLPNHIVRTVQELMFGETFGGQTANRLRKDYGTLSIFLSKRLYMLLAALMLVGLAAVYYRRFISAKDTRLDDEHIALATMFLGIFSLTVLVPSWGGGRPMMITFVFTTLYAVIGTSILVDGLAGAVRDRLSGVRRVLEGANVPRVSPHAFACLLLVLFLLNSGIVATTAVGGQAPSNVPSQGETSYQELDIMTHVWFIEHREHIGTIYGDNTVHGQTDWLNPQIAYYTAGTETYGPYKPRGEEELARLTEPGVPSGYVILLNHNVRRGTLQMQEFPPIDVIRDDLSQRNRIYSSGYTEIYHSEDAPPTGSENG